MSSRLAVVVLAALAIACDRHREDVLNVSAPLGSARLRSYTGISGIGWNQELTIRLQPGVPLSRAVDMAVFGPLEPGMTADKARQAAGSPLSTRTDAYRTPVEVFKTPRGTAEVGCREPEDSVGGPRAPCAWVLYAQPTSKRVQDVLIPPVVAVINAARQLQPEAESVRVYVCTDGDQWECVRYPILSNWDSRLEWYRRSQTAPSNNEMQLTKLAQAMELRS